MQYFILLAVLFVCGLAGVYGIKAMRAAKTQQLMNQTRLVLQQNLQKTERRLRDMELKALNTRLSDDETSEFAALIRKRNSLLSA